MENNNDFKYIIQDTGHIYFGKELTYQELLDREDVPFKFKAIISAYVSKDTSLDVKFTNHILYMDKAAFSYRIYDQLKMQIRIFYEEDKKGLGGRMKKRWVHKSCSLSQFQDNYTQAIQKQQVQIEDVSISKLALMTISI